MQAAEPGDEQLLEAFRGGDARAFEVLVRRYQRAVLGIARRFCDDCDEAEDLAQRSFINAAERAGGWRGGSFKSWLFRITVNLAKNHKRDNARFDSAVRGPARRRRRPPSRPRRPASRRPRSERPCARPSPGCRRGSARCCSCASTATSPSPRSPRRLSITEVNAKVNFHHAVQKLKELVAR